MSNTEFERLYQLVLDMKKDQDEIKEISIENSVILDEHMRRTATAEKRIEHIEDQIIPAIKAEIAPIKDHVQLVNGITKFLLAAATLGGTIFGIIEITQKLL